jgi:hypothetical protein
MKGKKLRSDLAALPGELVTNDPTDETRIHEVDPEHVRDTLVHEYFNPETEVDDEPEKTEYSPRPIRVSDAGQRGIDAVKVRVWWQLLQGSKVPRAMLSGEGQTVFHVWFPTDSLQVYELRDGNPPARSERPKYLRDANLVIDMFHIPETIRDELVCQGKQALLDNLDSAKVLMDTAQKLDELGVDIRP